MARRYLCVYHDMLPAIENLQPAEVGRLILAALNYDANGVLPAPLPGKESILWPMFMSQIDRNRESYKTRCEINRNNRLSKTNRDESNRIVTNRDNRIEENRKEKNRREENKTEQKKADAFKEFSLEHMEYGADLYQALTEFSEMRTKIKAPLTPAAKTRLLSKLKTFPIHQWIPILNQSVDKCWKDIYPLKQEEQEKPEKVTQNPFVRMLMEEGEL